MRGLLFYFLPVWSVILRDLSRRICFAQNKLWLLLHTFKSFISFLNSTDFDYSGSRFSWLHFLKICLGFPSRKTEIAGWVLTQQKKIYKNKDTSAKASVWRYYSAVILRSWKDRRIYFAQNKLWFLLHTFKSFITFLNSTDFDYSGSRFSWLHFIENLSWISFTKNRNCRLGFNPTKKNL